MDEETRRKVCRLIAGIVVVDDELEEREDQFVDRMLAKFGLSAEERDALFPIMDAAEATSELQSLPETVRTEAFDLLIEAAAVDGVYADEEKHYLHAVAGVVGVDNDEADRRVMALIEKSS